MIKTIIYWLIFVAFISAIGLGVVFTFDKVIMPDAVRLGQEEELLDITKFHFEIAKVMLEERGFILIKNEREKIDNNYEPGVVLEQIPIPGTMVKKGRKVFATVSMGDLPVIVPNLIGKSVQDAKFIIQKNKLILDTILYEFNYEVPKKAVMDQTLFINDTVARNDTISIIVSIGKHPSEFVIPDLIGIDFLKAIEIIKKSGFKVGIISYIEDEDLMPNTIVKQSPAKDEKTDMESLIDLVVVQEVLEEIEEEK